MMKWKYIEWNGMTVCNGIHQTDSIYKLINPTEFKIPFGSCQQIVNQLIKSIRDMI